MWGATNETVIYPCGPTIVVASTEGGTRLNFFIIFFFEAFLLHGGGGEVIRGKLSIFFSFCCVSLFCRFSFILRSTTLSKFPGEQRLLLGHTETVDVIAVSPNNAYLASSQTGKGAVVSPNGTRVPNSRGTPTDFVSLGISRQNIVAQKSMGGCT